MNAHDFTKGNIYKQLFWFSTPIIFTNLLQVSYQFIDSLWVGNLLGANALGAITVASTVIFTVLSFIIGINNATLTILSQQKGMENTTGLKNFLNAFVVLLTTLALLLGCVGYLLSERILNLLQTPGEMVAEGTIYLQLNFIGILFLLGYNFIATVLRALGDSKTPLKFVLLAVILNAILDPILISGFGFGIHGAAIATIMAQGIAFLYGMIVVLRKKTAPFSLLSIPKKNEVLVILKLGIPSGLQMMVISAGVMAIMSVVNSFGKEVVAGFGAAQRIDSIIMLPASALGTAVNSMAGQNIGANQWERVKKIAKYAVIYNFAIMLVIATLVVFFARLGVSLFLNEKNAIQFGTDYLQMIAFLYPFLGINFVLNGIVRAAGAMFQVLVLNVISFWVLRYPLTYVFSYFFGEKGIALGMGASFFISSIIAFLYYRFGKWKMKEIFRSQEK